MPRLLLIALGLSALLWTAAVHNEALPRGNPDAFTRAEVGATALAGDPHGPGDSDQEWRAQQHTIAAITESVWKSSLVHAGLAATRAALPFDTIRAASSPDPPVRSAPHYLRHTPLLI